MYPFPLKAFQRNATPGRKTISALKGRKRFKRLSPLRRGKDAVALPFLWADTQVRPYNLCVIARTASEIPTVHPSGMLKFGLTIS